MKFEKLTESKIRISVSLKDMESTNISAKNIFSNSADSQKLLNNLIAKAEKELSFKTDNAELLVEAIALSNNEYVFTITKLLNNQNCCTKTNELFIYKFQTFDDFINLCNFLKNFDFLCLTEISKDFSLFYCKGTYYLSFIETDNSSIVINYMKTFFDEFGKNVSNTVGIDGILNEYGKVIFSKNALLKCLNSFNTQKK